MSIEKALTSDNLQNQENNNLFVNNKNIINSETGSILTKIKEILENENLNDFECIEEIVCIFEKNGILINFRHDFG